MRVYKCNILSTLSVAFIHSHESRYLKLNYKASINLEHLLRKKTMFFSNNVYYKLSITAQSAALISSKAP